MGGQIVSRLCWEVFNSKYPETTTEWAPVLVARGISIEPDLFDQCLKARLVTHVVVTPVNLQPPTCAILIRVTLFKPIQNVLFVLQSEVNRHASARCDISFLRELFQIAKYSIGSGPIPGSGVGVSKPSDIPGQ